VVVDGSTGYLVPFEADSVTGFPVDGDRFSRDLAGRIAELMGNVALCERFGAAGRKRVEKMFAWEAIAKQTVELYRGLVG
jgi:starch synthase